MGRVLQYLTDKLRRGPLHMTLIDPEKKAGRSAANVAAAAVALGSVLWYLPLERDVGDHVSGRGKRR